MICVFFFEQKTAYEMRISDWSSDVCSSDLEIRLCVERSRADENEFDEAEEEAIYWLIYDRVRHLGLRKHKMFGHIMLCLMPIAAATDDLDDLDELIQEVAEWLSQFKSLAVMA